MAKRFFKRPYRRFKSYKRFSLKKRFVRRQCKRVIQNQAEKKYNVVGTGNVYVSANTFGTLHELNMLTLGTSKHSRIGTTVRGRFIKINMMLYPNGVPDTTYRIAIVSKREETLSNADAVHNEVEMWDLTKFIVYREWIINTATTNTNTTLSYRPFRFTMPYRRVVKYSTTGDFMGGGLYLYVWANDLAVPHPQYKFDGVFTYIDI